MSETCSLRSNSTSSLSRYRTISRGSSIDESLFGDKTMKSPKNKLHLEKTVQVLSHSDLQRMKKSSLVNKSTSKKISGSQHENGIEVVGDKTPHHLKSDVLERARKRKEHMIALELNSKNNELTVGKDTIESKLENIRCDVEEKMNENEDIVKVLKTYSQRAAAFAIRDKQLKDKAEKKREEEDYEKMMNLTMEVNRLKEIATREQEESVRMEKRIKDRSVIEDQIQERQRQKMLMEEAKELENRKMLERIKEYQDEELEKMKKRKEDAQRAQVEIIKRNEEIVLEKEAKKMMEKMEDERILQYQKQRDEDLRIREEEQREAHRRKVELQKQMLDNQEKLLDKRGEIDEIRARRAAEELERRHRQRELFEARKRKKDMKIMHEARKQQEDEKREAKQRELLEKKNEYINALKHADEMAKREHDEASMCKKKNAELRAMLQRQIEEQKLKERQYEQEKYEEGRKIKETMALERAKVEAIREKMVDDMKAKGVNEKYFGEMMALDVEKFLMK